MTYNDIVKIYKARYDGGKKLWTYEKCLEYRKCLGGQYEVQFLWNIRKTTYKPMKTLKQDDKITLAEYTKYRGLVDSPGWKWARRFTKNLKKCIRMAKIFASQTNININKYKCGVQVPKA